MSPKMVRKRERRSHLRFRSETTTLAQLSFDSKFKEVHYGLVCNESYSGCSVLTLKEKRLVDGANCHIKCGRLGGLKAVIRWVQELDDDSIRLGIEYQEK